MSDESGQLQFRPRGVDYLLVASIAAVVYFGLPFSRSLSFPTPEWFPALASAFLDGRLTVETDAFPNELIPSDEEGRYFVAYPPGPAVALIPVRLLFGPTIGSADACRGCCVLAIVVFGVFLSRVYSANASTNLTRFDWYLWVLMFGFGTAVWDAAARAGDWHYAHVFALLFFLIAMVEYVGKRRWLLIGAMVGFAMLARPTVAFAGIFFALVALNDEMPIKRQALFSIGPIVAILLLADYNELRFGDPLDFGYDRMVLRGEGLDLMQRYGQFDGVYVLRNLYYFFVAPPWPKPEMGAPFLSYDPRGMSLFIASPIFLLAFASLRKWRKDFSVPAALFAMVASLVPLLLYFNTGFWQFGHRFSLDYLPLLLLLTIIGASVVRPWLIRTLLVASIVIHIWGIAWLTPKDVVRAPAPRFVEIQTTGTSQ